MKARVSNLAFIPRLSFTKGMRSELTYRQSIPDIVRTSAEYRAIWGHKEQETVVLRAFVYKGDYVGVPRSWAFNRFGVSFFDDRTVFPRANMDIKPIPPRDNAQSTFFRGIHIQARERGPRQILANAQTGSGKSLAAINLGIMLDTPTLIVVDSNKIAAGFLRNFTKFFGREWTSRNVGRIQQDSCNYNDKPFCIAMVQSLMSRKYPEGLYSHFGLVVYDEVQIFGSRYHKALGMFKARVLVGMTATNKKGRFGTLVNDYLGTPAVVSRQEVLKPKAFIVRNRLDTLYNVYSDGTLINSLASDKRRNKLVANIIFEHGYKRNRVCLVLSDRVAQLQAIQHILLSMGVEPDRVGLHVAEYDAQTFTVSYSYGKTQQRLDLAVTNAEANRIAMLLDSGDYKDIADILPFALKKNLRQGMPVSFSVVRNTVKASQEALDTIANFCNIILATYKIFAKGVDYPRIDMGVEATPYGNITQPLGRTLRSADGFYKPQPEWYAIHDRFVMPPRKGFSSDWDKQIKIAQAMNHFFDKKASAREKSLLNAKATITYISGSTYRSTDNA